MGVPLYVISHFSPIALNILSLSLIFANLITMCLECSSLGLSFLGLLETSLSFLNVLDYFINLFLVREVLSYFLSLFSLSVQFSSAQSCLTHCDTMDSSMPGFPIHHQLLELAQTHVHRAGDDIQPSHPVIPFCSYLQAYPASGTFPTNQFFTSGGQSIAVSASASVLPMNT